jgi:hypothetical protein
MHTEFFRSKVKILQSTSWMYPRYLNPTDLDQGLFPKILDFFLLFGIFCFADFFTVYFLVG